MPTTETMCQLILLQHFRRDYDRIESDSVSSDFTNEKFKFRKKVSINDN